MKNLKKILIILALIAFSLAILTCGKKTTKSQNSASTTTLNWLSDFAAAKTIAAKEGKDIFLFFTGSDWCPWCKRLKAEVLDTDLFKNQIPKDFILLTLDFPRDTSNMSSETIRQNEKLYSDYKIPGVPAIILADANAAEYARTGYLPGGAQNYLNHLKELKKQKPK